MKSRKENRKIGDRLRHLIKQNDEISQNAALHIISQHGGSFDVINAQGALHLWSPIFWSVWRRNHDISHALMRAPALDVNYRDVYGYSILMHAMVEKVDHELIQNLLGRDDIDVTFKTYTTRDTLSFFKPPRLTPLKRGFNALLLATMHKELFQYIPQILDKMDQGINDYATHLVLRSSNNDLRRTVNEHGSAVDHFIYKHVSPLTNLVEKLKNCNHSERAFLLSIIERIATSPHLNANKKIKIQPKDESLLIAAQSGDRQLTEILLAAGANTSLTDSENYTAVDLAKYSGHPEVEEMIAGYRSQAFSIR